MSAHGITLTGYCARWASGLIVEPLGTWDSTGQEQLIIESASDEWQGVITATFWAPGAAAGTDMLMTDGTCIVPPEALAAPGNGTITLRCTNAAGQRISVDLAYHSAGHAQVPGSPSEPTPDLWQQYVEQVQADADRAEQASKDAAGSASAAAESAKQAAQATADIGEAKDAALEAIQQAQDTGVQAVQTATTTGVQAIQTAHQAALDDIATDRQQALTDIETEGEKQTSAITSGGAAALEAIGQVEQTAIGQVQQAGTTQVAAVQQAGQAQQTAIEQAGQSWQQQIAAAGTAELGRWAPAIWDTAPLAAEHDIYAAEGAPLRVTQHGATEQQTTTGAQLLSDDDIHMTQTGFLAVSGLAAGEYTLSITSSADWWTDNENGKIWFVYDGNSGDLIADLHFADAAVGGRSSAGFSVPEGTASIIVYTYSTKTNKSVTDIMLNAGSTALPWEPYTGGAPSPSPDYPQEIAGTGLNGKIVLDGSADEAWVRDGQAGKYRYCIFDGLPDAVAPDAAIPATCYCNRYRIISGDNTYQGILGFALYDDNIYLRDPAITSVESLRASLAENPLEIYYVSSDRSKQAYTVGISTEDDAGGYHGQALAIGSPLYGDGSVVDTVENDVASGCDQRLVLTGQEASRIYQGMFYLDFSTAYPTPATLDTGVCSHYPYTTYSAGAIGITSNGRAVVYTPDGDYTPDESGLQSWKSYLAEQLAAGTPVTVWYKSTAYTDAADLHIDKVTRRWKMVELDGTEDVGNYWNDSRDEQLANGRATFAIGGMSVLVAGVGDCTHFELETRVTQGLGTVVGFMSAADTRLYFCVDLTTIEATAQDTDEQFAQKFATWLAAQKSAGTPVRVLYPLATPEEYASDPHTLPALGSLPETVKATGQSTVSYSADTKHYIDSKLQAIAAQQLNLMIGGST